MIDVYYLLLRQQRNKKGPVLGKVPDKVAVRAGRKMKGWDIITSLYEEFFILYNEYIHKGETLIMACKRKGGSGKGKRK